jgi:hypothetical protein
MEQDKQEQKIIDRYLSGHLTGAELEEFLQRLQADPGFRERVDFHSALRKGIEQAYTERNMQLVLASIRYRKSRVPVALKLIFFFLLVTVAVSSLWFYLAPDAGMPSGPLAVFDKFQRNEEPEKPKAVRKPAVAAKTETAAPAQADADTVATPATEEPEAASDSSSGQSADEEVVVKRDELLISFSVPVAELTEKQGEAAKPELADKTAQKLNPAAGLPEPEPARPVLSTEFWVSPVNYRGYRFAGNKLILFGIEEPDKVRLYRYKEQLYMVYLKSTYRLSAADDFSPYQKLKESDVPLALKSGK